MFLSVVGQWLRDLLVRFRHPSSTQPAEVDRDRNLGLYRKYNVTRSDGSSEPGGKHHDCYYYVLDVTHDPHAKAALLAYADSCGAEYPYLARDLRKLANS